jgi:fatty-acyl-CoA synthase
MATEGLQDDSPLLILYTSGTTGRPKGAVLTHGSITWNAVNTVTGWDLRRDDVTLTHTPFFHTGGWNVLTLPLLHRGGTVVLCRKFEPAETLAALERHGVTVLFAVPTMFQMILDCSAVRSTDLSRVRFFISGGASCPVPLIEAFQQLGVVFKQGYGLTEVGPNCFVLDERDAIRKAGSVGFPVLHLDVRLAVDGREVRRGEVGELQLRGPTVCAGYFNKPEASAQAMTQDGFFATGDLFRQDEEGYFYVVGRLKEMYKSGGENVYPAEVERVLYEIPEVVEAAVVGVPDEKWGEVGHAFVALRPAQPLPAGEAILEHCRHKLAKFKVPRALTILDSLPKGASGKIHKQLLQQRAAELRATARS